MASNNNQNEASNGGSTVNINETFLEKYKKAIIYGAIAVIVDTGGPGMGKYTDLMKDLAKEKKALFVPAIMAGIFTDRSLKSDMIHPNAKGYAIIAQRIHKRIKPYVE